MFSYYVILGKFLSSFVPYFLIILLGSDNTCFISCEKHELTHEKGEYYLAYGKHLLNIILKAILRLFIVQTFLPIANFAESTFHPSSNTSYSVVPGVRFQF